jgi:hypothetical protein
MLLSHFGPILVFEFSNEVHDILGFNFASVIYFMACCDKNAIHDSMIQKKSIQVKYIS